jgi:hypothetical protein
MQLRSSVRRFGQLDRFAAVVIAMAMLLFARWPEGSAANKIPQPKVDDLLIVDCLLPGQIRQLGREVTYVTRRKPLKQARVSVRFAAANMSPSTVPTMPLL